MKLLTVLFVVILSVSVVNASEFEVGQMWAYKTRPVETESTLTIVKIDNLKNIKIIHISLAGLKIKYPGSPSGFRDNVPHLPISEEALRESVTKIIDTTKSLPGYEKDYQKWRKLFGESGGGYFTGPVKDCVEYLEQALNP